MPDEHNKEQVWIPLDTEEALRALLKVDPDAKSVQSDENDPDETKSDRES